MKITYPSNAEILGELSPDDYGTAGFSGKTVISSEISPRMYMMLHATWFYVEADGDVILTLDEDAPLTLAGGQSHSIFQTFSEITAKSASGDPVTMLWAGAGPCELPEEEDDEIG